ncbi:MFS transporter [Streptomyces sp. NPDC093801]|uniref:MFS transporter n=1 Tax=Streptomyces sp. NPDC093801 TaxID=3155203 RepID=UPI00344CDCE2
MDRFGPRRSLVALLLVSSVALALIGAAPGAGLLLGAVALGGAPQAPANPAADRAILAAVPPARRGAVTGMKQSGVQLGAFAAGLPLAALASGLGWRGAVWAAAGAALATGLRAARTLPVDPPVSVGGPRTSLVPRGTVAWLAVFSLFPGCGIASVNTCLALFGPRELGLGPTAAAALVAVLGATGNRGPGRMVEGQRVPAGPSGFPGGSPAERSARPCSSRRRWPWGPWCGPGPSPWGCSPSPAMP